MFYLIGLIIIVILLLFVILVLPSIVVKKVRHLKQDEINQEQIKVLEQEQVRRDVLEVDHQTDVSKVKTWYDSNQAAIEQQQEDEENDLSSGDPALDRKLDELLPSTRKNVP
jgi:type II secretory pathway pseudopilin PulG